MLRLSIRAKLLIHLVRERPALWDKTSEEYKDRSLKEISWCEICTCINKNYNSMPAKEKEEFTKTIIKKWTHIRDCWVKSMRYGFDEVTKIPPKPYIYHAEMKFMQKILKCKPQRFDINMCQSSNMHFEEFYREVNETQNSNETSQEVYNNERLQNEADGNFSIDNLKQEPTTNSCETEIPVYNKAEDLNDADDWHSEDTEIMSVAVEEEKRKQAEAAKRKRKSIFLNSRNEYEESKRMAPTKSSPAGPIAERSGTNFQRNDRSLYENRHWNFFMGILPSVGGLDEDHILEFQSGVISLLQNLRQSQKQNSNPKSDCVPSNSLFKGRSRKHNKTSVYEEERDLHNSNSKKKLTRRNSDPIAPEEDASDIEYLTDN